MDDPYDRTTVRCSANDLPEPLRAGIQVYAEEHQLDDPLAQAEHCYTTHSVRQREPGLLARLTGRVDPDSEHVTAVLITETLLLIGVHGRHRGVNVRSARLDSVTISKLPAALITDPGVSVTALWFGVPEASSFHVGADDGGGGRALVETLRRAVGTARGR
ncbi:hypothetical protein ACIOMM_34885 [Streptomyces sp. NPDC087908]|uniref:hypothetical protein n=1 Tax=Streptomyces sp. NPDC087908 TaxID=3365820 RepID=UPI003805A6F2